MTLDFVSSDTTAQLFSDRAESADPSYLNQLAVECITGRNFFTGLNPAMLLQDIRSCSDLIVVDQAGPWLWDLGPRRYLVAGLIVQRTTA